MTNIIKNIFADFIRIFDILPYHDKIKTALLFGLMVLQTCLELFFILTLTYMGTALTDPDGLREKLIFQFIFTCFPVLQEWTHDSRYFVLLAGLIVVIVSVLKNIISYYTSRETSLVSQRLSITIGSEIMSRFLYRDYAWHLTTESAMTFQRMMWRGDLADMLIALLLMYASILTLLALFLGLAGQEPVLTSIVIAITGTMGICLYHSIRRNVERQAQIAAESAQEETRALLCTTKGIRDVLIYGQQDVFLRAFIEAAQKGVWPRTFKAIAPTMPSWVLEATGFLVVVVTIAYLVYVEQADTPRITEALALLMLTAWRVLPYANRVVSHQVAIRTLRPTTSAVLELLDILRAAPCEPPSQPATDFSFARDITLKDVSFRYPSAESDSLHDLNFTIPAGKMVGIIGPSGAGKSTLIGVLSGLLRPCSGQLLVDGEALNTSRAAAFARLIGYVPQSPFLFAGTLAENIAFSQWKKPWDETRMREACRKAAIDFVDTHPLGLNQPVGEDGTGLSGGQAQRVAIARALYAKPELLIFDEATSALDQANENNIQQTIIDLAGEITCVIIAHKLSTVEKCDLLIWMEKGCIVMQGDADHVLSLYRKSQKYKQAEP
ncbi:MAG: ABC transporter ATP-binding protein [Desulfovibrionaceae bacterium]|nr:ABC transporter ATP-binding protein [Desulfovibrionaceae bacterium]